MTITWVGLGAFIILIIIFIFYFSLLLILRHLYKQILSQSLNHYQKQVVLASMFMIAFSVLTMIVKQAISMGFIAFHTPIHEAWFHIFTGAVTFVVGGYVLFFILNKLHLMKNEQKKEPV